MFGYCYNLESAVTFLDYPIILTKWDSRHGINVYLCNIFSGQQRMRAKSLSFTVKIQNLRPQAVKNDRAAMPLMIEDQKPIIIYWSISLFFPPLFLLFECWSSTDLFQNAHCYPRPQAGLLLYPSCCVQRTFPSIILRQLGMGPCGETQGKCLNLFDVIQQHSSLQTISLNFSRSFSHFSR